jgi:2-polyprenyl-3-methyl-5-hydroxy-6-metoxy-1,4-benzoquinol methylase
MTLANKRMLSGSLVPNERMRDKSNGYEAIAGSFVCARTPSIGPKVVRAWAKRLDPGASILDIGCGYGVPVSETLLQEGFHVYGVDASESLVAQFGARFPGVMVECNTVEDSRFFDRTFDAIVAWGLFFILAPETQRILMAKVARALNPGGHFLFTSLRGVCSWEDEMTGLTSISLGHAAYEERTLGKRPHAGWE